ncbi:cobalamin B12-binding domain-containing protein [candidate division WOR-3 bacterium]|nr:cobalamin B12-binding domain-containing protein [candidate division WOR-3 bacterium]
MKRVLLISPPARHQRPVDLIPIGLLSIAGYLRKHGYAVAVYNSCFPDQNSYDQKIDDTTSLIRKYAPDFIGIGFPSDALDAAATIARTAKDLNREVKVIVGGIHPTAKPRETVRIPYFDFLIHGEGEITTRELLDALIARRNPEQISGISYRSNGIVIRTDPRPEIDELDDIPFENRDLLVDLDKYPKRALGQIHTSRGCPYGCAYCSSSIIWKKKVRFRSVGNVMSEIAYLYSCYRVRDINFADDNLTLDQDRVAAICEAILERKFRVNWRCCSRPDIHQHFSPAVLRLMRKAGCRQICVGFESGDQGLLDNVGRGVRVREHEKVLELMMHAGIRLHVDFIIGLPGESKATLDRTFRFMKRIGRRCRPTMSVALFKPYPGTRLGARKNLIDHANLYPEFKKIFDLAEACNIKKLSRDPVYVGRKLLDNISAPKNLGVLIRSTLASFKQT